MSALAKGVATVGYVGYLPPSPGTWGSLAALPLGWLAMQGGPVVFTILTVLILPLGVWATADVTRGHPEHDPSEVVIDELLGQWVALMPVAWGAWSAGAPLLALWPGWIAAFLLFRFFDILKVGPVGWLDRRRDVWGVMLDDVVAGVFAALGVVALAGIAHL